MNPFENNRIVCLAGDGVGPEIMKAARLVLDAVSEAYQLKFTYESHLIGGSAIDANGVPLPDATLEACQQAQAVLLGAVGGPKWDAIASSLRPEAGLLKLRKSLALYCNLRPVKTFAPLIQACPLKQITSDKPLDFIIVRELTGGIYFGERGFSQEPEPTAWDVERYSKSEIERIASLAFSMAQKRRNKITSIDKANVLESSRLWRKTVSELASTAPFEAVSLDHQYVDNCAMQLILNPHQYDVLLTNNIFGDILSDEASTLVGSIGLMPSASLRDCPSKETYFGLYEPIHGSAPDIAGLAKANPTGMILSVAMMLRYSFGEILAATAIENAINDVFSKGIVTPDLAHYGTQIVDTTTFAEHVARAI